MSSTKDKEFDQTHAFKHGKYGSYGDQDLVTFQAKLDRNLVNDFESIRRKERRTKREMLEEFIHWCKYENLNRSGLLKFGDE